MKINNSRLIFLSFKVELNHYMIVNILSKKYKNPNLVARRLIIFYYTIQNEKINSVFHTKLYVLYIIFKCFY